MISKLDPADLFFLDEAGVNLAMTRRYAWAPTSERATGAAPKSWGDNVTLAAALGLQGVVAPLMLRGSMDGECFTGYIEQFVAPELKPGQVLIMDNLSVHKAVAVRAAVEARGAQLVFLPPYSPDLSPIERAWSKVKEWLRSTAARTWDDLLEGVEAALRAVSPADAVGWFRHSGYRAQSS